MAVFGYSFVPQSENGLPSPTSHKHERGKSTLPAFGRARVRYVVIALGIVTFILFFTLLSSPSDNETSRFRAAAQRLGLSRGEGINGGWCSFLGKKPGLDYQPVTGNNQWQKGSGRDGLSFDTPFNPDDFTMTEDECDAFFPDLYKDINRSVDFFSTTQE